MTILQHLTIEKILWRGRGLARLDTGKAVIVEPGVLPGEMVDVEIIREKKDFIAARPHALITPSPLRRTHPCPYWDACGGCTMGVLPMPEALSLKKSILKDTLTRSLHHHTDTTCLPSIQTLPSPRGWRYRYRGQIHVHNHRPHYKKLQSSELLPLKDCLLFVQPLGEALPDLARTLPDGRFTVAANPKDMRVCTERDRTLLTLPFVAHGFDLILPSENFFQAHWELNQTLVQQVTQAVKRHERVADLYAGAGNFSLPLAHTGHKVLALESVASATQAGASNAKRLGLKHLTFQTGNLAKDRTWQAVRDFSPTAIILDPPRAGARRIANKLLTIPTLSRMVWVSCDVVNTCRDLAPMLHAGWDIQDILLVDMFPQTWHMEVVFILTKNCSQQDR